VLGPSFAGLTACGDDPASEGEPNTNEKDSGTDAGGNGKPDTGVATGDGDGDGDGDADQDSGPVVTDAGTDGGEAQHCTYGARDTAISNNHPVGSEHALLIPLTDLTAAANGSDTSSKMYTIQGLSAHFHMVTLTAAELAQLAGEKTVMLTSTQDMGDTLHDHKVTVHCF
jgi:hypothetical protein